MVQQFAFVILVCRFGIAVKWVAISYRVRMSAVFFLCLGGGRSIMDMF
jgi:hypothetical protein